jgi:hypothetical protein
MSDFIMKNTASWDMMTYCFEQIKDISECCAASILTVPLPRWRREISAHLYQTARNQFPENSILHYTSLLSTFVSFIPRGVGHNTFCENFPNCIFCVPCKRMQCFVYDPSKHSIFSAFRKSTTVLNNRSWLVLIILYTSFCVPSLSLSLSLSLTHTHTHTQYDQ